jgi:hypothetical protein
LFGEIIEWIGEDLWRYEGLRFEGYGGLERDLKDERGLLFVNEEEERKKLGL